MVAVADSRLRRRGLEQHVWAHRVTCRQNRYSGWPCQGNQKRKDENWRKLNRVLFRDRFTHFAMETWTSSGNSVTSPKIRMQTPCCWIRPLKAQKNEWDYLLRSEIISPLLQHLLEGALCELHEPRHLGFRSFKVLNAECVYSHDWDSDIKAPFKSLREKKRRRCKQEKDESRQTSLSLSKPSEWPCWYSTFIFLAKRRLPSMMNAIWRGIGPFLSRPVPVFRSCFSKKSFTDHIGIIMLCWHKMWSPRFLLVSWST